MFKIGKSQLLVLPDFRSDYSQMNLKPKFLWIIFKGLDIKELKTINKNAKKGMEKNKKRINKIQDMLNETESHQEKYERFLADIEQAIQKKTKIN